MFMGLRIDNLNRQSDRIPHHLKAGDFVKTRKMILQK